MTQFNTEKLYDYLFHYNPYEELWYAFKRKQYGDYFNGKKSGLMKNKDFDELTGDILIKINPKYKDDKTEI